MSLEACLPPELQRASPTITPIAAGLSGAGVYRVEAAGQRFVLKLAGEADPVEAWRRKLHLQRLAADAGLAPRVIHSDEAQRAVLTDFVIDRSFPARFGDPRTREAAVVQLGQTLRRVHDLPLPSDLDARDSRALLATLAARLDAGFAVPAFVRAAIQHALDASPPACDRAAVLSHNDVNPTNLVYDGERVLLLDWDTAAPNDPYYDLATISMFLRMDDATCLRLLEAHDGAPCSELPPRFVYDRRLVAVLCGAAFLDLARQGAHAGATGAETLDTAPSLENVYQRLRSGALHVASAEGQWSFGLALVKSGVTR